MLGTTCRNGSGFPFLGLLQLVFPALGVEVAVRHHLDSVAFPEGFRPFPCEHDVRRGIHHKAGKGNGILDMPHARDCPGIARSAIHDGGIEFHGFIVGEDGTKSRAVSGARG